MNQARQTAALWSIAFGLLMFVPLLALGAAIGWPASLDLPAAQILPLIPQQQDAVRFGYLVYLAYSVIFFPTIAALGQALGENATTRLASQFALISALARSIGILRWLTAMPALAGLATTSDPQTTQLVYAAINSWGGGIGELLGVSLFGLIAIALVSKRIFETDVLPRWLGGFGMIAAAALVLPWLEVFGINLGPIISVSVAVVQLWFLALGTTLFLRARMQLVSA